MYRQIALAKPDKEYHRILWREQKSHSIQTLRLTRVTYGVRSSAHQSVRGLQEVATAETDPETSPVTLRDFAVDHLPTGEKTVGGALQFQELSKAGFNLRKWSSNSSEFMRALPANLQEVPEADTIDGKSHSIKVLGTK